MRDADVTEAVPQKNCATQAMTSRNSAHFVTSDRKSTRLNSSHSQISYAVFCLKKKKQESSRRSAARRHKLARRLVLAWSSSFLRVDGCSCYTAVATDHGTYCASGTFLYYVRCC